jgi:thiol-disulfide isomerase/thioredoxin
MTDISRSNFPRSQALQPPLSAPPRAPRRGSPAVILGGILCLLVTVGGCAPVPDQESGALAPGPWRATLASPGGAIPFGLDLVRSGDGLRAFLVNGEERRPAGLVERLGERVRFELPPYRSAVVATLDDDGRGLAGYWERDAGEGPVPLLPFAAVAGTDSKPPATPEPASVDLLTGRWRVRFDGDEEDAVGLFEVAPTGRASGTFLTTLGDYRYLSGWFDGEALRLGCFDGAHAFLFEARLGEGGRLTGDFWSRDSFHTTWVGDRDDGATLPDDFTLTRWTDGQDLGALVFPDLEGERRSLAELLPPDSPGLLVVFGTWCPNCNDLTEALVALHRRHPALQIAAIAFELGSNPANHREAVREYVDHHGIDYPVVLGGTASKSIATEALPILDRVRAYPTTVFLAPGGRATAVHTGFSGPATGKRHAALLERFESEIESLVGPR